MMQGLVRVKERVVVDGDGAGDAGFGVGADATQQYLFATARTSQEELLVNECSDMNAHDYSARLAGRRSHRVAHPRARRELGSCLATDRARAYGRRSSVVGSRQTAVSRRQTMLASQIPALGERPQPCNTGNI